LQQCRHFRRQPHRPCPHLQYPPRSRSRPFPRARRSRQRQPSQNRAQSRQRCHPLRRRRSSTQQRALPLLPKPASIPPFRLADSSSPNPPTLFLSLLWTVPRLAVALVPRAASRSVSLPACFCLGSRRSSLGEQDSNQAEDRRGGAPPSGAG